MQGGKSKKECQEQNEDKTDQEGDSKTEEKPNDSDDSETEHDEEAEDLVNHEEMHEVAYGLPTPKKPVGDTLETPDSPVEAPSKSPLAVESDEEELEEKRRNAGVHKESALWGCLGLEVTTYD